jgi:hypothetical protein
LRHAKDESKRDFARVYKGCANSLKVNGIFRRQAMAVGLVYNEVPYPPDLAHELAQQPSTTAYTTQIAFAVARPAESMTVSMAERITSQSAIKIPYLRGRIIGFCHGNIRRILNEIGFI